MGRNRHGANGGDVVLKVPVGTEVLDEDKETVIADLDHAGARLLLCRGGNGGFGNTHFKGPVNQAPRHANPGLDGEERAIWMRLKLIADVGLVGLPNAGKSTFLAAASAAKPKIASYPFTTLHPNLGIVDLSLGERFVLADIPGLIEGASEGAGIGTRFLGHVERTAVLVHLVDGTQDDVAEAYRTVRAELRAYGGNLARKKEIVALNKTDAMTKEDIEAKRAALAKASRKAVHVMSGVSRAGVRGGVRRAGDPCAQQDRRPGRRDPRRQGCRAGGRVRPAGAAGLRRRQTGRHRTPARGLRPGPPAQGRGRRGGRRA